MDDSFIQENDHSTWSSFMKCVGTKHNRLNILHVNIRSMLKNFAHLEYIISSSPHVVHIIIITEVNLSDSCVNLFQLPDYNMYSQLRRYRKGGGIIMFVHSSLSFTRIPAITSFYECITGEIDTNYGLKLCVCAVYRPPDLDKTFFIKELASVISSYPRKYNYILLGDININLKQMSPIRTAYLNVMSESGLECGISQHTRVETKGNLLTKSCIDHIFARITNCKAVYSSVIKYKIADHYITGLTLVHNSLPIGNHSKIITKIDNDKLRDELRRINWKSALDLKTPTEVLRFIARNFSEIYEKCKMHTKIKLGKRHVSTWINDRIRHMCNKKLELFEIWKQDENNVKNRLLYNKYRNKTNKYISKIKNDSIRKEVSENFQNTRKIWQIINNLCGRISNAVDDVIKKHFSEDFRSLSNKFARGFEDNINKICKNCEVPLLQDTFSKNASMLSMRFKKVNDKLVFKIISHLNKKKSPGIDSIRVSDLQCINSEITPIITHLINLCISTSSYPDELKTGIIRPIHKKGPYNDIDNYRPITILPSIDKIVERYIGNEINNFLSSNNIINKKQFGFQKGRNTTQLLSAFSDEVNKHLGAREQVLIALVDFSKAFDTLRHKTLFKRLEQYGMRGPLLKWLKNYHKNRHTVVRLGTCHSEKIPTKMGTAQGSILGPTEYIIYVNDMCEIIPEDSVYQFADDTCLVTHHKNIIEAETAMQCLFDNLCKWAHDAGLVINASKTKIIHIHSPYMKVRQTPKIIAHDHQCLHRGNTTSMCACPALEAVDQHTYLGLTIDKHFNWAPHIESVCNKLRSVSTKLAILKYKLPFSTLRMLYLALADSVISYGLTSYGRAYKTYLDKIYRLQLGILKNIVPKYVKLKYKDDENGLFKYCKVMSVFDKFRSAIILEKFNNISSLTLNNRPKQLRNLDYLPTYKLPKTVNVYDMRTWEYILPDNLNKIPKTVLSNIVTSTYKKCKSTLKSLFITSDITS